MPALLAVVAGVVALVETWRLHRRHSLAVVAATTAVVMVISGVTLGVWWGER